MIGVSAWLGCISSYDGSENYFLASADGVFTPSNQIICEKHDHRPVGKSDGFLLMFLQFCFQYKNSVVEKYNYNNLFLFLYFKLIVNVNLPHLKVPTIYLVILLHHIITPTGVQNVKVSHFPLTLM